MNLEIGSKYRYEYFDLPDVKSEEDLEPYIEACEKIFPKNKKVYTKTVRPKFQSDYEKDLWEEEEVRRCKYGHDGLSGKMYFWFNYVKIKNPKGQIISPEFRVCDAVWFHLIESCEYTNYNATKGVVCVKRRRAGFSWKAACDATHDSLLKVNQNVGMTSKGERDAKKLFEKVRFIYERLPSFLKHPILTETKVSLEFARTSKDEHGNRKREGNMSTLYCVPPVDDCFEGDMLTKGIIDEGGKIDNVETIWSVGEDTFYQETTRVGIPLLFGTAGEQDGVGKGQKEFWENNDVYDLIRFFFPGWAGQNVDKYGNDDIRGEVLKIWKKRIDKIENGATDALDYIQKYPLSIRDAFLASGKGGVGNALKIASQIDFIKSNPVKGTKGKFRWGVGSEPEVVFEPDMFGPCMVYAHPNPAFSYAAGCDPADHDYTVSKNPSDLAMYIANKPRGHFPPTVVFKYVDRPLELEEYYDQSAMALIYYNRTKVLIESNRFGMIRHYKNNGYISLLKPEPQLKTTYKEANPNRYGVTKGTDNSLVVLEMERCINQYTTDYAHLIPDIDLLKEFEHYKSKNTDKVIAFGWMLLSMEEDAIIDKRRSDRQQKSKPMKRLVNVNGKLVWR